MARRRKNEDKKAERQRESVSQAFGGKKDIFTSKGKQYVRMGSSISTVSRVSAQPEELWSNNAISSLLVPTVAPAVRGRREAELFKAGQGSQKHSRRSTMTFQEAKALQSVTAL